MQNMTSGVYKITNNITGDFYIGSSKNIKQRWYKHRRPSVWKQYPNIKLYKDMAQYGKNNFIFEVLEETTDLRNREQYWVDQLKPSYNVRRANGQDIERYKEWYEIHRDEHLAKNRAYGSRLCLYKGETLTLRALTNRFFRQGIPHSTLKAKEYLL